MTAISHDRGWEIYYNCEAGVWLYSDTEQPVNMQRQCKKCGRKPTKEGYDACIGYVKGVYSACCGHGVSNPIMIFKEVKKKV